MNSIAMMGHGKYNLDHLLIVNLTFFSHSINTLYSIDLDYACDGEAECLDHSDEIECDQIEFLESYDKSVPRNSIGEGKIKIVTFVI